MIEGGAATVNRGLRSHAHAHARRYRHSHLQAVYNTKGTRAHTHRELIREWLWEPKGSSLESIHRHHHDYYYYYYY